MTRVKQKQPSALAVELARQATAVLDITLARARRATSADSGRGPLAAGDAPTWRFA